MEFIRARWKLVGEGDQESPHPRGWESLAVKGSGKEASGGADMIYMTKVHPGMWSWGEKYCKVAQG